MRVSAFAVAVILVIGLFGTAGHLATRVRVATPADATAASVRAVESVGPFSTASTIAAHPDRGQLFTYDQERQLVRSGGSTWLPVQISEKHALRAIAEGGMTIQAPNGETIRLRYERHFEHPDGNWTWIGREEGSAPGTETVLTFGEKAVFGVIRQGNADLKLTTEAGSSWLVQTNPGQSDGIARAHVDDVLKIPNLPLPSAASDLEPRRASGQVEQVAGMAETQGTPTTLDIAMGFTTGFATRLGGESQARTRLNFLVDVTNQTFLASGINAQIRLVRSLQVDYPDATHNRTALFDLTGVDCTEQTNGAQYMSSSRWDCVPVVAHPVGLQPLIAARETYGADLLVLVRKFEAPENGSCGMAWMLGGGQNAIDANSAAYGMSVVDDSSGDLFPDNGTTCPDVTLAHELGHNLGQQHDLVSAMGSDDSDSNGNLLDPEEFGRHAYSFGYSTDGTASDIATIMSNRRPSQTRYRVFGSPLISTCGGAPCGTAQEDNARSMGEVMPVVAGFRTTQVDFWDVTGDHWAYDFIRRIFDAGITAGCGTNPPLYCPDSPVTRDQMAVFLLRGIHGGSYVPPTVTNSSFSDVPSNHWAISWIERLFAEGITTGCGTNPLRYCPNDSVSRDQMAVFLLRAKHGSSYTPPPATGVFDDVPVNYWAAAWIEQLAAEGITTGCSVTPKLYCPTSTVTRDQMAVFLARTYNL